MKRDKEWLIREIMKLPCEVKNGYHLVRLVDTFPLIDQLDEPNVSNETINDLLESNRKLAKRVKELEPEKVVIPQFVDDFIKSKEKENLDKWKMASSFISDIKYKKGNAYEWSQEKGNMDKFLSALVNDYEVEKEKLYYLVDEKGQLLLFRSQERGILRSNGADLETVLMANMYQLTEKEIKDYDPRYWPFAIPVEEE